MGSLDDETLIHELSHVWQYGKVGAIYIPDALTSQHGAGVPGKEDAYPPGIGIAGDKGYQYGGFIELEKRINNGQKLSSFNYEQQASIIEDYYKIREDINDESKPETANNKYLPLYAYFVQEVSTLPLTSLIPSSLGLALSIGTNNAERIDGDNRDNTIFGLAGDDFIDGGLGDDRMYGGLGNDTFVVNSPNDLVKEFPDQGVDTVNSFISYTLGDNLENLTLIGNSALVGTGNNLDNIITGNDTSNTLAGLAGSDTLKGLAGDDLLIGGAGADVLIGGAGIDTASYTTSPQGVTINLVTGLGFGGDATGDTLQSIENLQGSAFSDTFIANADPNRLDGSGGVDTVSYVQSSAGVNVNLSTGLGSGGFASGDRLINIENIEGSDFDDTLVGDSQINVLNGRGGNDVLEGRAGKDTLIGGAGFDTVSYATSSTGVVIDLSTGSASGGDADGDILIEIEGLSGSQFSDTLIGDNNANTLSGLGGNDVLQGRGGNDRLNGGAGNDSIDGGTDIDTVIYETSPNGVVVNINESQGYSNTAYPSDIEPNFTIAAGTAFDGFGSTDTLRNLENIIGSTYNDILIGNAQQNTLNGLAGNDLLVGNGGDDILDGGNGIDTVSYRRSTSASGVSVDLSTGVATDGIDGVDTLINIENIVGSQFADRLTGNSQANTILGGDGNDIIAGLAGDDRLFGENGNDEIYGGTGNDYLIGGAGADLLDGGDGSDTASYITSTAGVTIDLGNKINFFGDASGDRLISIENLEGSEYDDFLYGDENDNTLSGLGGNDIIRGAGGDDRLDGGTGDNILNGGDGNDTIVAADGKNTVYAESGNDSVLLGNGNNTVFAGSGNNSVIVGNGDNTIYAESGNDSIVVGNGNNTIVAGDGKNTIAAGSGNDTIYGGAGTDVIDAGAGNNTVFAYEGQNIVFSQDGDDIIYAGAGRDFISAGGGNDTIFAGDGDNWIAAGTGNNLIYSGNGANLFILEAGAGFSTIKNFKIGKDKLGLTAGLQPSQLTIAQVNSDGFFGTQIGIAESGDVLARLEWTPANLLTASSLTPNLPLANSSLISLFG